MNRDGIGKFYYLTDLSKKDQHPNLIRQIAPHPYANSAELNFHIMDEDTFKPKCWKGSNGLGPEDKIIYKMTEEELNTNYVSIAPKMIAYLVVTKDESIMHCVQLVIVEYDPNLQKKRFVNATTISIYEALSSYFSSTQVWRDRGFRFFDDKWLTDLSLDKQYKYKIVEQIAIYSTDDVDFLLENTLYRFEPDKDKLIQTRDEFMKTGHTKLTTAMMTKDEAFFNLRSIVDNEMNRVLAVMPITLQDVMNLKEFTMHRSFDKEEIVNIVAKVIEFEKDPYMNIKATPSEIYEDLVMKNSLIIFPYSFKTDLDKIKNDNKLYNMVVGKCETGQVYVIMFRKAPIEYRKEEETGFTQEELKKLVK